MDPRILSLYDEYTHAPLDRRVFLARLAALTGGIATALSVLPLLEAGGTARAAIIAPDDERLATTRTRYKGATGDVAAYVAHLKAAPKQTTATAPAKRPAVVVIHENRGLNAHIEDVTRRFALEGFLALAPDLLSPAGGTPADADSARAWIGKLERDTTVANLVAAIAHLETQGNGKVGAVGFCWGGGMVGQLAVQAPNLDAGVVYYGRQPEAADVEKIRAPLLLHYAGQDERINAGIPAFRAALDAAKKTYTLHVYEGVQHAFNNDTSEERYNKEAADLAWSRTIAFLEQHLGTASK
jgi:carboxymethylenebutenolidase